MHPARMFSQLISFSIVLLTSLFGAHALANSDIAKRISDGAAITGSRVLIIGFEGLAGFNYSKAAQLEAYQCKLSHGMKAMKPFGLGGGHVTSALLVPVVEKHKNKVKTAMFAHNTCTVNNCSLPAAIGKQWMADAGKENTDGRKVIIVGHSFGGDAAAILARQMAASGVAVDSVYIIDGRKRPTGMGSVGPKKGSARWVTFYQWTDAPLMGFQVKGAENIWLPAVPLVGHILLPHNKKILNSMMDQIGEPPGEEVTTAAQDKVEVCKNSTLAGMGAYRGTPGIVEGVPIAAVVGGGGYLAYQAIKKKKSGGSGGDSGEILVADSLVAGGKKTGDSDDDSKAQVSSADNSLVQNSGDSVSTSSEIISKENTVVTVESNNLKMDTGAASRLRDEEKNTLSSATNRSPASRPESTRFSKDSLQMATGKNSANNIGGATSLVDGWKKEAGIPLASAGSGASTSTSDSTDEDAEDSEKEEEEELSATDTNLSTLGFSEADGMDSSQLGFSWKSGDRSSTALSDVDSVFSSRMSLFERVNRKLRQKMLSSPQKVRLSP